MNESNRLFIVYMSVDWEGVYEDTIKIFANSSDAQNYASELKERHKYKEDCHFTLEPITVN